MVRSMTIMVLMGMIVVGVAPATAAPMEHYEPSGVNTDIIDIDIGTSKNRIPLIVYALDLDLVNDVFDGNYTIRSVSTPSVCMGCFNGGRCPIACIIFNVRQPQKADLNDEMVTDPDPDPADLITAGGINDKSPLTGLSVSELNNMTAANVAIIRRE
jgi:hypothetical protein